MVFSSFTFLFLFLPMAIALYWAAPARSRNAVLLLASLAFYGWGAPDILPALLGSCIFDYFVSKRLGGAGAARHRKLWLVLGIGSNVALLAYYKYANFFVDQLNATLGFVGATSVSWTAIALPIGISFFTFQKISYLVDVSRGTASPARGLIDYALYVSLFPQLIAGPIVRYHDVEAQIKQRSINGELFLSGLVRFSIGLGKKVLIADTLGAVTDNVFRIPDTQLTTGYIWLGMICYAFQIYYDFSGYSDMALGLGRMFGFRFLENFNFPYTAQTITEFWRRWHISLSNWMREYLYIPLGGSRESAAKTYRNLWLVFFFSGLWHGAAWNFVVWGLYHGAFLVLDRVGWSRIATRLPRPVNIAITFLIVLIGWVLFRADSLSQAGDLLARMFLLSAPTELLVRFPGEIIHYRAMAVLAAALVFTALPILIAPDRLRAQVEVWRGHRSWIHVEAGTALILFCFATLSLAAVDFSPFLYFRF